MEIINSFFNYILAIIIPIIIAILGIGYGLMKKNSATEDEAVESNKSIEKLYKDINNERLSENVVKSVSDNALTSEAKNLGVLRDN